MCATTPASMPTLRRDIDDGANFPAAPSLPAESDACEAVLSIPTAPIVIKKEDEGVNFPAAPPLPAEGGAGEDDAVPHMPTTPIKKEEDYDASTDEEVNFHAPDREKRRRVDDLDGVDGADDHDRVDGGGGDGKIGPVRGESRDNDERRRGGQDGEYPSPSANGGMIRAGGGVDGGDMQSHRRRAGQRVGGEEQRSSVERAPDGSDADSVDHVLREDYDVFDGSISFCCQNCR